MTNSKERVITCLQGLTEHVQDLGDKYYNHFNVLNGINEVHVKYFNILNETFGDNKILDERSLLKSEFNFNNNDFLLMSFKSYKGQIPSNSENGYADIKRRRFNLYKKGKVWSDAKTLFGKNFYDFLDRLNSIFEETPVNIISYCNYKFSNEKNHPLRVLVSQNSATQGCIYFPTKEVLLSIKHEPLTTLINLFDKYLSTEFLSQNIVDIDNFKDDIDKIHSIKPLLNCLIARTEFKDVYESFIKVFNIPRTELEANKDFLKTKIFYSAILYSYNHLPFNLYLYYPKNDDTDFDNLYTLMVAINPDINLHQDDDELFKTIVSQSPSIPKFEKELHNKISINILNQSKWEYIFEKRIYKYNVFAKNIENICNAICQKQGIHASVTSRVKTFESFYNKLFKRANSKDADEKKLSNDYTFEDAIRNPEMMKEDVFKTIRDIAGVRIVCVFDSDVWRFVDIFSEKMININDLVFTYPKPYLQNRVAKNDPNPYPDKFNYRGFHVTVSPGNNRKLLIEYEGLIGDILCEIQVRSILAHGWSDVQHPMQYKDKLQIEIINQNLFEEIDSNLNIISKSLKDHDKEISDLKGKLDKLKFPIDEAD
jgi:ppGpp synthetase/RelA/SpoT-type nucleotidyltranferase